MKKFRKGWRPNIGIGLGIQYTTARPEEQGPNYYQGCAFLRFGGCLMGDNGSPRQGWYGQGSERAPVLPGGKPWGGISFGGGFGAFGGGMTQQKILG